MAIAKENKVVHGDDLTMIGQLIKEKFVRKETGKGLSTNDYTTEEKAKLAAIEAGAQANVQPDWSQTDSSADDYIKNKPSIPEGVVPSSSEPLMDGSASAGASTAFARGDHRHPTDTSRAPLASPEFTGTPTAPTAAQGTNSTQIATTAFVKAAVDAAVGTVYKLKGSKATYADLPATGNEIGDVWNVVAAYGNYPAGTNWAWDGEAWDALGGAIDLSGYAPNDALTSQEVTELLNLS